MDRTKLAVCIDDEEYKNRFVECVMKHYKELFEIHVVNYLQEAIVDKIQGFDVVITGDDKEIDQIKEMVVFVLVEKKKKEAIQNKNVFYTEKYQEVYKIMDAVENAIAEKVYFANSKTITKENMQIGVFSLRKESMQIAFTTLLAEILGENQKVLVMDIQPFSGLVTEIETEDTLGMEDLMSVATTQNYTENRVAGSIGHELRWDFIYPVKNVSCLAEANEELYQNMLGLIQTKKYYDYVIINFGSVCSRIIEFMEKCHKIYILTENKTERNWRELHFIEEMKLHGKEHFLQRINWVEIPVEQVQEKSWRQQIRAWLWSELGDFVRKEFWMEYRDGTDM